MLEGFKNILIIKPSSLGDIVMALPALSALRKQYPDAKISWLIRPEFAPLLDGHPHLTETIMFDRKSLGRAFYNPRAFGSLISLIRLLRHSKFDLVIDLQGLFRTASLGWLSGCKKRFGMANARELAHLFYTHKVRQTPDCTHVVDYYLKIIQTLGVRDIGVEFVLPTAPDVVNSAGRLLIRHGASSDNYAVIITSSIHPDKRWPTERFAALADRISAQFGLSIVATGTAAEKDLVEMLKNLANVPIANLAGLTKLNELTALLRAAKLVVTNDTGPGHIAAALGIPLVMIFGPSNPVRLFPYGRPETLAAVEPFQRGLKLWSTNPVHVIESITVDYVYQKVCENMAKRVGQKA